MNREETRQMHRGSDSRDSRPGNAPAGAISSASAVACVRHLIGAYRRFLKTSYRFLDPHLRAQFEAHLQQADVVVRGPWVSLARDFERGRTLPEVVASGGIDRMLLQARWPFGEQSLYLHQERALEAGRSGRSFVVTTGTGSGKTEAFLLPVLDGIVQRKRRGTRGVQAILLYPMNALANDQLERLRSLLRGSGLDVSYALYTGVSDAAVRALREEPAETERLSRADIRQRPPDVLLTNYKQLEFLLVRSEDRALFTPALRYLVLDELHSYRGALATEIACLIRRLKAHAALRAGQLVAIGTSATVASGADGAAVLADFATTLFGELVHPGDVIGESLVPSPRSEKPWVPPAPELDEDAVMRATAEDVPAIVALAERLTGRALPRTGTLVDRIGSVLVGNAVVEVLEDAVAESASMEHAIAVVRERVPERAEDPDDAVRREIEAYLLVGSIGDDERPPRLRPKLHLFFHGVYDVSLCLNPSCRLLVPQGGAECPACGAQARPAALCRTCGQDFVKVRFEAVGDELPVGTGDFYSDERTAFLTYQIHQLPEAEDEEPPAETNTPEPSIARNASRRRNEDGASRLKPVGFCTGCGRVLGVGQPCPACGAMATPYLMHKGSLHTCPACGDVYTRADIVTPLRTGTASTVSAITTHHLDLLVGEDRKLLVFADNRQDVAHQAGYTSDKHRSFALRHLIATEVRQGVADGVYLQQLPQRLFDGYRRLGIVPGRPTRPERDLWLAAITYEAANEFTRHARQRASLENLGLVGVEYEFLEELAAEPGFTQAAATAGLEPKTALALARAVLDVMRKNRAVAYDFFQEYLDPERKRRYRELEADPYGVRFPDRDRSPKGFALDRPDHIRKAKSGSILGFFQENPRAGQLTAVQKLARRLIGDRASSEAFLRALVPLMVRVELLVPVPNFPLAQNERTPGLRIYQINPKVIRLMSPDSGYRCNACQTWRPYSFPACPTPRCESGTLQPDRPDPENYYVRLYTNRAPGRLAVAEHSAQIPGEERAKRETEFKEGRLDALVCTPTLELGVDIGPLLTVALRNAPPTPANYMQRVGRAGRRLRIGFVSTFCAGGAHDRHAFEDPGWLVAGRFTPPRLRLDNPRIVRRHLRSFMLESVQARLPNLMGDLLDDVRTPTRWTPERLAPLFDEVNAKRTDLTRALERIFADDRAAGRTVGWTAPECETLVDAFESDMARVIEGWWQRVHQLDREFREYSQVGSPRQDEKKAQARKRAYWEITQDPEGAYFLNYLATQDLLPAYQFPVDTFTLDPGVVDTPTLYRPAAIAIEEFAPGNFVYANGHKLLSIRVLFPGGPGAAGGRPGRTDAETSGRLRSFQFCGRCDEVIEATRNACARCGEALPAAIDCVFVEAFEAEEALRIGSDEESRQRQYHVRRERLLSNGGGAVQLFPYPFVPIEYRRLARMLVTNWGRSDSKTGEGMRFWLCPDCGRHQPYDPSNPAHAASLRSWRERHRRFCAGEPAQLVLGYEFQSDCLVLAAPSSGDILTIGRRSVSPTLVTLAEALVAGAGALLELEPFEIAAFPRRSLDDERAGEIVFYETVPGGAGYLEQMAARLPEVAQAARERLYGHYCGKACYLCLKHYRNQQWHAFFDKHRVRDVLFTLSALESVSPRVEAAGTAMRTASNSVTERRSGLAAAGKLPGVPGPASPIEARLLDTLRAVPDLPPPVPQYEIRDGDRLITVPDFAYPDARIAVFCDGFAFHGNPETLELDAKKRNWLQSKDGGEWIVLTYWGRTILKNADACAREIADVYRRRAGRR